MVKNLIIFWASSRLVSVRLFVLEDKKITYRSKLNQSNDRKTISVQIHFKRTKKIQAFIFKLPGKL